MPNRALAARLLSRTNFPALQCRFFFAASGYFWGVKIRGGHAIATVTANMVWRISMLYLFWSLVYLFPFNYLVRPDQHFTAALLQAWHTALAAPTHPLLLLFNGTKYHLWFLPALICSVCISAIMVHAKREWLLFATALGLYLTGLLMKAYVDTPLGIVTVNNSRNGAFFGTIFFVSGYFISAYQPQKNWLCKGLFIALAGAILQ
ncbi:MAG: acyltransferase family protein, partial [Janthinobacterium lividum]